MYKVVLIIIGFSIVLLMAEAAYVLGNLKGKIHAYLLFYILCCLVNNVGYLMEMTAKTSEAAYTATRLLYLGKMNLPFALLIFVLRYCKAYFPLWRKLSLFVFHQLLYGIVITNDLHHLYYNSITFVDTGLFRHNVYGHGPVYYLAMAIPYIYFVFSLALLVRTYKKLQTRVERRLMLYLLAAPFMAMIGTLIFFTGKTGGFDTGNVGLIFGALLMVLSLSKFDLIDTVDMVKDTISDSLGDGLLAIDSYGTLVYLNNKAKEILEGAEEYQVENTELLLKSLEEKVEARELILHNGRAYVPRTQDLYQENLYRGKLFVFADMTESIKHTRQIEEERDRADTANAAKSVFLSNMSHEIRTPMNAVIGMTDILLRNHPRESDVTYLENIKSSGNALLSIINDILDFSKIESGKLELVYEEYALLPIINDLKMVFLTRIGEKPIQMLYEIDEKLPAKLYGDGLRIRQILINLVNNAIKFTEEGQIKVSLEVEEAGPEEILLHMSVSDSGQGIRQEDMGKLFLSFSQVDSVKNHSKEGTGLGLTITKQLLEMMGGTIGVESTYGEGTDFFFSIPQKVIDATPAKEVVYIAEHAEVISFIAPAAKVLLVEDNEVNVKVALGLLAPLQMQIEVAKNGLEAVSMVSQNEYDLILMDHMMPVMDGVEAAAQIRAMEGEYYQRVPIIALTANAVLSARGQFFDAGMNDYVGKPIEMKEILVILRKWLPAEKIEEKTGEFMEEEITSPMEEEADATISTDSVLSRLDERYLDMELGLTYCGTPEIYEEVLYDFYKLIDGKSALIENHLSEGKLREYTVEVHSLKSTARTIGATELSELAYEMEQAGNAEDLDKIAAKTPELLQKYREYKDILSGIAAQMEDIEQVEVPRETILADLEEMCRATREFDLMLADEVMDRLKGYRMPTEEAQAALKELDTLVMNIDYDGIADVVSRLKELI